jgi:hypothetical protein
VILGDELLKPVSTELRTQIFAGFQNLKFPKSQKDQKNNNLLGPTTTAVFFRMTGPTL